jgi:hypothetical protein
MQGPFAEYLQWKPFGSLVKWWRMLAANADALELDRFGDELRRIAADAGLDEADLRRLIALGPHSVALLPRMMEALNLDSAATPIEVLRDLQRVCAYCTNKAECTGELVRGSADTTYMDFCPNAATLRSLQLAMQRWPSRPQPLAP